MTITALVPSIVHVWLEVLEWDTSNDLSSLEVLQVGGSMLDENLAKRIIQEMKCKLQQVFGMAEGLICCTSLDDPESVVANCQGRPLSDADEVRIVDEHGNDVEVGAYGELLVRGPYTISGYYRALEQNRESFTPDGFYRSGDKARITPEGNFQIGGRIKEQINRAGEKIMPAEVEAYLRMHPDIKDAALITLPDQTLGEKSCAYVITDNQEITLADIHAFFHEKEWPVIKCRIKSNSSITGHLPASAKSIKLSSKSWPQHQNVMQSSARSPIWKKSWLLREMLIWQRHKS
ncbi:AMP-binding protein [Brevibacillus laterosporus]